MIGGSGAEVWEVEASGVGDRVFGLDVGRAVM